VHSSAIARGQDVRLVAGNHECEEGPHPTAIQKT